MENPQVYNFEVKRTARYYTLGILNQNTQTAWIVIHGYGELAGKFIEQFAPLAQQGHFVIAPEALSRFYWKGFSEKAVASWMTTEDRVNEINDYVQYIYGLQQHLLHAFPNIEIQILGFSQGVAVACRCLALTALKVQKLYLFGSFFPHDIDWENALPKFQQIKIMLAIGNKDAFIDPQRLANELEKTRNIGVDFYFHLFEGKHEVDVSALSINF